MNKSSNGSKNGRILCACVQSKRTLPKMVTHKMALHLNSTLDMQSVKFTYFLEVAENTENGEQDKNTWYCRVRKVP